MKRVGLGWTIPIVDADVRRRALELADRLRTSLGFGPYGDPDEVFPSATRSVRCRVAIDGAMGGTFAEHLSVTEEELDGVLAAAAMVACGATSAIPDWLRRRGGITEAAKRIAAVVAEFQPIRIADLWPRFGGVLAEREWSRFLVEAIEVGIVLRTSDARLVTLRVVS